MKLITKSYQRAKYTVNIISKRYFDRIELRKPQINSLIFQLNTINHINLEVKNNIHIHYTHLLICSTYNILFNSTYNVYTAL